jgi:SAM-dependent methyltransferase
MAGGHGGIFWQGAGVVNITEANLYDHVNRLLAGHEKLLRDAERNRLFHEALRKSVTGETSLLDIGSGTGIWAIVAARLGARRVVAIEQDQLLVGLIKTLARENRVSDRVEVIQGDSRQVQLGREFDVVISETIGNLAFDEQIVPIMIDARERFLKPGGLLIPESVALVAVPGRFQNYHESLPAGISVRYEYFESLLLNHPVELTDKTRLRILGDPQDLVRADLASIKAPPDLNDLTARWKTQEADQINCFAIWADTTLTKGTRMTTDRTSSWSPVVYRISPFEEDHGEIEFKLSLTEVSNYWTATLTNDHSQEAQSYSPAVASTVLLAQTRADFDVLSHYKRIGLNHSVAQ